MAIHLLRSQLNPNQRKILPPKRKITMRRVLKEPAHHAPEQEATASPLQPKRLPTPPQLFRKSSRQ
jgi:hypothetical protein